MINQPRIIHVTIQFAVLCFLPLLTAGQSAPIIEWQNALGGSSYDMASGIYETADGGFIVAGQSASGNGDVTGVQGGTDIWVVKLDSLGGIQWQQTYGGTQDDGAEGVRQTNDGGYIVAGWTESLDGDVTGHQGGRDYWVLKLDGLGALLWQKAIGGSGHDESHSVCQTIDGGYAIVGWTNSADGDVTGFHGPSWRDIWAVKLDSSGNIVWQNAIGGSGSDEGFSIIQHSDGGLIIAGHSGSVDGDVAGNTGPFNESNFWVVKLNSNGQITWEEMYGGSSDDKASSIQETSDGGCIVSGQTWSNDGDVTGNHGSFDAWIIKLDSVGTLEWQNAVGGSGAEYSLSVQETSSGHFTLAGWTESSDGDITSINGARDFWLVEFDPLGNMAWQRTLGGSNDERANSIASTSDDGYALAGFTLSDDGDVNGLHSIGTPDMWVVKLNYSEYDISAACNPNKQSIGLVPLSTTPLKICTDGSSATRVTVTTSGSAASPIDLRFRMSEATSDLGRSGYFEPDSSFDITINQVTAEFTHPTFLDAENATFRSDTIEIYDLNDPANVLKSMPVEFYRAPIVFLHGLGANQRTFRDMNNNLLDMYPWNGSLPSGSSLLYRADYSSTNCHSFIHNKNVVPNAIDNCVGQAVGDGYSCAKTTIIGHSMGGILPRIYLQSYNFYPYRGDVHSLITLNSPHFGTQFADWGMNNCVENPISCLFLLISPFSPCGSNISSVQDLSVYSRQIRSLNRYSQQITVPTRTLASNYVGDSNVNGMLETLLNPIATYNGELSDLIVPLSSQLSNSGSSYTSAQWHVGAAENPEIQDTIRSLLNQDPYLPPYFTGGFQQDSLEFNNTEQMNTLTENVTITNTVSGQSYVPNDILPLSLNASSGITEMLLFVRGNSIDPIQIDTTTVNLMSFQVPSFAIGKIEIFVFGGDGSNWLAFDSTHIQVNSAVLPDSLVCFPRNSSLPLGLNERFAVTGYFGSTSAVDLLAAGALNVTYDISKVSDLGDGLFQGIGVGDSWVVFEYLGTTDSVFVSVVDDPSQLVSAFDYNQNTLCAGDSIQFANSSLGLVTNQLWDFPGGSPSSSVASSPSVSYTTSGYYDVTLITTFVNGADTLILSNFIDVLPEPDTSIVDNGGSLFANANGVDYQWIDCMNGNMPILGETNQEFFPSQAGTYAVQVSNGQCTGTSACFNWVSTGILSSTNTLGFTVVPNPTQGDFSIRLSRKYESVDITITDATGRIVLNEQHSSASNIMVHLDSPIGVYFLRVQVEGEHSVVKLLRDF